MPRKPKQKPVTVKALDDLLQKLVECGQRKDLKEDELTVINKEYASISGKVSAHLDELERTEYENTDIGKFTTEETWRVSMPQTDLDKAAFFEFLKERGLFEKLASVNSNSLNALYMSEWKEAQAKGEGMTFSLPGVPAPVRFLKPKFKARKT